jgi:hypothetical protein
MPVASHIQYYAQTDYENAKLKFDLDHCSQRNLHRTATTPATAITAAATLPKPWLEAPPVELATDGPVADADADSAGPEELVAPAVPLARKVDVIPEPAAAAVVMMVEVFVQEQEESYDSVV